MRKTFAVVVLAIGLAVTACSAPSNAPTHVTQRASVPVALSPYWISRCRHGIHDLVRPTGGRNLFPLTLSEYHGCMAGGPGTFLTMSRWAKWNRTEAYGYGRWQSGIARVRVWLHRPVWTHSHGTRLYFSQVTVHTDRYTPRVTYGRWSWNRGQWLLSR